MRTDHRQQYVSAMVQHAIRKTKGRVNPLIVAAARFFMDAADRNQRESDDGELYDFPLVHPFSRGDDAEVLSSFFDELHRQLQPLNIVVIKAARHLVYLDTGETMHNKEAVVDDANRTSQWYEDRAECKRRNPAVGMVLFGQSCTIRNHPLLMTRFKVYSKPIRTMVRRHDEMVLQARTTGLLGDSEVPLLTARPVA